MEKLLEKSGKIRLLDHSLLEFWTDKNAEISERQNSLRAVNEESVYVISMAVWRSCDSADPQQKYRNANLVVELLSETKETVDAAGGTFILNLKLGLWTIPILLIVFITFSILLWKIPGFHDVLGLPRKRPYHKID